MALKKTKAKTRGRPVGKASEEAGHFPVQLRVRMYRHGLGECFLLTFPRLGEPFQMLIECGVTMGTPEAVHIMDRVASDIMETTGGRLDVVVATHPHWDKVSGFVQARVQFDKIKMGEVWMGWTEDPFGREARKLRQRRGTSRTEEAMEYLRQNAEQVRYLRGGDGPISLPGVSGVRVFVLGPPSQNPTYGAARSSPPEAQGEIAPPFDALYRISLNDARNDPAFAPYFGIAPERGEWRQIGRKAPPRRLRIPLGFDAYINDSSVVLAMELVNPRGDSKVLLFPGDAQIPSWMTWHDYVWPPNASPDDPRAMTCRKLLQRTVLYKVSHYGSRSGTPIQYGLEMMTSRDLVALLPADRPMALKKRWILPHLELLAALGEKTRGRVIRSDQGVPQSFASTLSAPERDQFKRSATTSDLYIDYLVAIPQLVEADQKKAAEKWTAANDRRVYLVDKKLAGTISPAEEAELREIEQLMDEYLSYVAPTGTGLLTELRRDVARVTGREPGR